MIECDVVPAAALHTPALTPRTIGEFLALLTGTPATGDEDLARDVEEAVAVQPEPVNSPAWDRLSIPAELPRRGTGTDQRG
jgi:hypothetical protein